MEEIGSAVSYGEVLRKEAAKCQRKTLLKYKIALEKSSGLEELLHGVCLVLFPKPSDYDARRDLIRIFNEIVKEIYGCSRDIPRVVEFGSFTMDLFAAKSDLDLSVNFSNVDIPRDRKISTLKKLAKKLNLLQRSGHVHGVNPITRAIVPVLKVIDSGTGVECDISVGNKDGILKSKILYFVSLIDESYHQLMNFGSKVEDFTDRSQNVARAVGESEMKRINDCIHLSIERISDFLSCRMEGYALSEFLFGKDVALSVSGVTMNCNTNVTKSNAAPGLTTWRENKDAMGGHKASRQTRNVEHRGQSALGKRTRTDGSSVPSTNTKRMRNTGASGQMQYSETYRAPYLPIPIAHPTYASNTGNWLSSDYVRESDIATSLVTPIVYHPSHPHDQLQRTFRPPNLPTPSVYPTFPPIANQRFPSHAGETLRVANLPSASSDLLAYPLAGSKLF
nr:protein HESO1-like [Ipomoea batatas]